MVKLVGRLVGLALVVALVFANVLFWNTGDGQGSSSEETTITDYTADFVLEADGDLVVRETLRVDFPLSGKRGIFQFFDRVDPTAPGTRRRPQDVSVTRDGRQETFEILREDHGRYTNIKIGQADVLLAPGEHIYEIAYTMPDALQPGEGVDQESQFYWQLVPSGWQQDIERAELTVHLPTAAPDDVQCAVGLGATSGCELTGAGTDTLTVTTGPLPDHTPVSLKTGLDVPTPEADTDVPWPGRLDRTLGTSPTWLGLVLLLALGAGVLGARAARRAYEADPAFPLLYAPPDGIGPAQARYILTESLDQETFVATLLHAAERGAITLDKTGSAWTITDAQGAAGWAGLDEATLGVAHLLGGPGTTFVAAPTDVTAGERLKKEIATFEETTKTWATREGLLVSSGLGGLGGGLVLLAWIAVLGIAIFNPLSMTSLALVPAAFALTAGSLVRTGSGTKRTRTGRDLWSRVGGFKRILATDSAQDRFDFSGREELYTAYIPWAVAFGCADQWAAKYRTEMGREPPTPHYLGAGYAGAAIGSSVGSMVDDFDSTVSSAISSYQATQSSSSSGGGGGGFSGGGGGGGGGGGSW